MLQIKERGYMPKIFEYLGIVIMFYSNEHEPIHVHGKFQAYESKAEFIIIDGKISDIKIKEVKGKKPLPKKELKEFSSFRLSLMLLLL